LLLVIFGASGPLSFAENWPQFRGPRGDGTSQEKDVPTRWSQTENIAWKTPIRGVGHSSPVVWENSVFLTSATEDGKRLLIRLDATSGKVLWEVIVAKTERESMHRENSSASSTVATDGESIITSFQVGDRVDLRSYDFNGKLRWGVQPLRFSGEHGYSYSPIFYKDMVIFDCRQEREAATIAFDKATGKVRWRTEPKMKRISHITPLIINDGAREQLLLSGSDETASYDPKTGRQLWWCKGPSDVAVAGMCYGEGLVFTTAGYPDRTRMAIRTGGSGDVTETGVAWTPRSSWRMASSTPRTIKVSLRSSALPRTASSKLPPMISANFATPPPPSPTAGSSCAPKIISIASRRQRSCDRWRRARLLPSFFTDGITMRKSSERASSYLAIVLKKNPVSI
jgi:outer membrane protein assembly factor BamB